ncbi:MAG TPA: thioredoxin [Dehalococcoidia bacterium]|jgi:thioredoxin 1|nr:thioredoxin [SAR202 cluster bacterium]PCH93195.1 MAG: thioredoxin [Dehalococcoidia bacterium]HAC17156.1 thioredoxin [Dehalococcoidia bacterium]HBD83601.1 thioredoxin [Dehalococcoidia bacterium]HIM15994.1 thioredoxin [Dehalococcoidia bacterium]|tara:strand:- start:2349 stop:2678 length:330 start_codon:yes stop_codon:yes gene_type:complete
MAHPIDITDDSFNAEVIQSDTPVLVDFWAEWCGPCKMIAPIVEELAEEFGDKIKFTKLDVDTNPQSATNFGIRGIPTLLIFNGGKPVETVVGAVPKSVLKKKLDAALAK